MYQKTNILQAVITNVRTVITVAVLVFLYCLYGVVNTVLITQKTGTLEVSASDAAALLTITQSGREARSIGVGEANIHLLPGTYQVTASNDGYRSDATVTIQKKRLTIKDINILSSDVSATAANFFDDLPLIGPGYAFQIDQAATSQTNGYGSEVIISAPDPASRQAALQQIRDDGYDPSDYKISFKQATVEHHNYTYGVQQ